MKNTTFYIFILILVASIFASCTPQVGGSGLRSKSSSSQNISGSNIALGYGFILPDNPIILSGNANLDPNTDLNQFLTPQFVSGYGFLKTTSPTCDQPSSGNIYPIGEIHPCYQVSAVDTAPTPLQTADGKWAYNVTTPQFLQVNTYFHLTKIYNLFFSHLDADQMLPAYNSSPYDSSLLPSSTLRYSSKALRAYADCNVADNAFFEPSLFTLCFGFLSGNSNMKFAQDSSIIYHETGHFLQKIQLNSRNLTTATPANPTVDMGNVFYNEAGALGEGLSDYYSYFVNKRPHLGEWAAGRILNASRPMTESDPLHAAGISTDPSQRLSYPQWLDYDPNYPLTPVEDVHYSGMIISHYLVALTLDLENSCGLSADNATSKVIHLISETLAELGDLTTKGTNNGPVGKINYNVANAKDWFRINNPINYRSFAQTFAKNLLQTSTAVNDCNGGHYSQDQIESILDEYGLLLFRTYNQKRNFADPLVLANNNTVVSSLNRKKSVLISKTLIKLDPTPNASAAFVVDSQSQIAQTIASLEAAGIINSSDLSATDASLPYNNGNSRVSPGEVVAISPNIYNDSNATMGGIQILANDWDHVSPAGNPYIFEQWPLATEGGVAAPATTTTNMTPVCLIQSPAANGSATSWITQKAFRLKVALDKTMCLNPADDKDCFIRAIKGTDQANFSKLSPKSNYGTTLTDPTTKSPHGLEWGNIILMQVSKNVPPGTVVNCRLRARFTNCEDCYHDPNRQNYDYKDLDYNGAAPFKIIQLQFSIID